VRKREHGDAPPSIAGSRESLGPPLIRSTAPALGTVASGRLGVHLRNCLTEARHRLSPGYPKSVMPQTFGSTLTKTQLADLVAFIAAGSK